MGTTKESNYVYSKIFPTLKVAAMEETLTQAVINFKEIVLELEQLHLENKNYKKMLDDHMKKLENPTCSSCDDFKKIIEIKEQILDSVASTLNQLTQTKNFNLIEVILKKIYGHTNILTPPKSVSPEKENELPKESTKINMSETSFISPKKEVRCLKSKNESVSEIEGTPTGRKSPIFQSKKTKTSISSKNSLSLKDKKKCPETWPTPEKKTIKLSYPSPTQSRSGGRMRQGRLSFIKMKSCSVVDLTCSPENSGEIDCNENNNKCKVKKEPIDNDETILPSPTSGPVNFPPLPSKRPLAENVNIMNVQNLESESSMSILQRDPGTSKVEKATGDVVKRIKTNMAAVYKEPAVRKKAEKRALPGWSCDECRIAVKLWNCLALEIREAQ
ncbi:jg9288 [Pararge aegeria aegeria]|uniref:Jg9288 protein n=2 Tax=Pararge aegeria aegeria TaxID=348720 RepID=A0A8S4SKF3_9NEOP|nr:jg9288 [Pararge aegeria aegeria]